MKTLAIIPARKGSVGVPGKNTRLLNGKPLIAYTIEAAQKSLLISKIVVTTDDANVKEIALRYGIEVIDRPSELAKSDTPMLPVLQHAVREAGGSYEAIVLLQPTSPLRKSGQIDECVKKFLECNYDCVYSVTENRENPYWSFSTKGDKLVPLFPIDATKTLRQELEKTYRINGAVYVFRKDVLVKASSFPLTDNISFIIMPPEDSVDIDTEFDFKIAEALAKSD